jgi:hypothetical protein
MAGSCRRKTGRRKVGNGEGVLVGQRNNGEVQSRQLKLYIHGEEIDATACIDVDE